MKCWTCQAPREAEELNQGRGDLVLGRAGKQPSCDGPSITLKARPLPRGLRREARCRFPEDRAHCSQASPSSRPNTVSPTPHPPAL